MFETNTLIYAIVGGVLPAFVWLWFWLKEDARKPEPRILIALSFLGGMVAVFIALPVEEYLAALFPHISPVSLKTLTDPPLLVALLAATEEIVKFSAAYLIGLRSRFFDEPIDAMIYLITVALGFAAMENMLYVWGIFDHIGAYNAAISAEVRFVGATLLHVVASATIGFSIAYVYYKGVAQKFWYITIGVLTAILLHTVFNLSIMKVQNTGNGSIFGTFAFFWAVAIVIILLFEVVKRINRPTI